MPKKSKLLDLLYKEPKDSTKDITKKKKKRYNTKDIEGIVKPRKYNPSHKIITPMPVSKTFSIMVKERDTPGHHIYVNYKDSIINKSRPSPLPESYVTDYLNPQQEYRLYKPFNPTTTSRVGGKSKKSTKSTKSTKSKKSKKSKK